MGDPRLELVRRMYVAASRPETWPDVLEQYRGSTHSALVSVLLWDRGTKDGSATLCVGPSADEVTQGYNGRYGKLNPHMRRKCNLMIPGTVTFTHRRVPVRQLMATEYFADYARPLDVHAGMGLPLLDTDQGLIHVTCLRPFSIGLYDRADALFVRPLIPHFRRALQMTLHLRAARASGSLDAGALDVLDKGVLVIGGDGRVLLANTHARKLVAAGVIRIGQDGIQTSSVSETQRLRCLIRAAAQRDAGGFLHPGGLMTIVRRNGVGPVIVTVAPAPPDIGYPVLPKGRVTVVLESRTSRASQPDYLRSRFGLTPAMARLAGRLLAGETLAEAAEGLGTSRETARSQVKQILERSGARTQSDFIRLALQGTAQP